MSRNILARVISALDTTTAEMTHLLDIGEIGDDSTLDRKVQSALDNLYEVVHEIKKVSRQQERLAERGPLVFPMRGRDMRYWRLSDGRKAEKLLSGRQASRIASASKVMASPGMNRYRVMTASQYLKALEDAVITENRLQESNPGYEKVGVFA
jgi:hypothetical protein